jgi:hypothetical protein
MDRFDALADRADRPHGLGGDALAEGPDDDLQRIVVEVAATFATKIALVCLLLRRIQLFRAHTGLPADLAHAGGTDRDVSFCQFVVRDRAPLVVSDAKEDPRLPQLLVDRYGIRSYLGAPVVLNGNVVGTVCAIDTAPRTFSADDVARIEAFAAEASRRLRELTSSDTHDTLGLALSPALEEVRNIMTPMMLGVGSAETALAELGAFRRMAVAILDEQSDAPPVRRALTRVEAAHGDLRESLAGLTRGLQRLKDVVTALEAAILEGDEPALLEDVLEAGTSLAHHMLKLLGGIDVDRPPPGIKLAVRRSHAVLLLSTLLGAVAGVAQSAARRPSLVVTEATKHVRLEIRAGLSGDVAARLVERLSRELPGIDGTSLAVSDDRPTLSLRRA